LGTVADSLEQACALIDASGKGEIVILAIPATAEKPKEFLQQVSAAWGLGGERDNGLIILVTTEGKRRLEIESGRVAQRAGMTYPTLQRIADESMLPLL